MTDDSDGKSLTGNPAQPVRHTPPRQYRVHDIRVPVNNDKFAYRYVKQRVEFIDEKGKTLGYAKKKPKPIKHKPGRKIAK